MYSATVAHSARVSALAGRVDSRRGIGYTRLRTRTEVWKVETEMTTMVDEVAKPSSGSLEHVIKLHRKYHGVSIPRSYIKFLRAGGRRSSLTPKE